MSQFSVSTTVEKLKDLRDGLNAITPYPWAPVDAWRARARPLFRDVLPKHLEDFEAVTAAPSWVMLPRWSRGNSRWSDEGPSNNFAEAEASENRSNGRIATEKRDEIVAWLDGLIDLLVTPEETSASRRPNSTISPSVFLVHGHDDKVKETVARFLERLGLQVTILHEQPDRGKTIIEKFEHHADVGYAVVLLTGDDVGASRGSASELNLRARQNVVFELGYFLGRLGRGRVCALKEDKVEVPSDLSGVLYVPLDSSGAWRLRLAAEVKASGIEVDLNRAIVT